MTVSGRRYELDSRGVQSALEGVLPEPIHEHFAVINGRRWPPKQVLALVTGWIGPISPLTRPAGP
jgi:hypothetical protein